ncbi:MAG: type II toxin-antitoxin system RelE/ParE family toxin [Gemmatimonadetes bacterium]|nr:type II toxin-antitoxin system RelE/ParE family toxin [Gemmatimonadota bacterium]
MRIIRVSPEAEDDLIQAAEYLDRETGNPEFGHRLHDGLDHVMELIAENPWMGRARPDLEEGLRAFHHARFTIFWRLHVDTVEIVRVLHQRQDVEREFGVKR